MILQETTFHHRIIIIDDNTAIHEDFKKILVTPPKTDNGLEDMESLLFGDPSHTRKNTGDGFEISCATQGEEGLEIVRKAKAEGKPFSLAFVDGRMPPGWDGIETIRRLWMECPEMQAVLCTAYADYSWQEIQNILGKHDSLLILKKPFDNVEVLQMAHALTRKWELNQEIQGRLNKLAFYDHLTGLPNRSLFINRLKSTLDGHLRYGHKGALLFIDLDNFKRINDTLGHSMGDELLKIMADRLLYSLRVSDTVSRPGKDETAARLGGDEFTVLLPEISNQDRVALIAKRIIANVSKPVAIGKHDFMVSPSIGIAIFPDDGKTVEALLKNADLAMYFAKRDSEGSFKYYQESMNDSALKRVTVENQLRYAIAREELFLHYQPQVALPSGKVVGVEALLRWENQELGNMSPLEFISIAEDSGQIIAIGEWVMRTACYQIKEWIDQDLPIKRVAVNVSIKQFTHFGFSKMVQDIIDETGIPPHSLEIEITESLFAHETKKISAILTSLREKSILIAVDDFGTGYSSLSRLKHMPIDCLKIDRSFVCGVDTGMSDKSIIGAIMAMARGMELRVIAEGVDNTSQLEFLIESGCQEAQGFYFSRPRPPEKIEALLHQGQTIIPELKDTSQHK